MNPFNIIFLYKENFLRKIKKIISYCIIKIIFKIISKIFLEHIDIIINHI